MRALVDGDIIRYEVGSYGQLNDEDTGEVFMLPFNRVSDFVDCKIAEICRFCEADKNPLIFFTGDKELNRALNKRARKEGRPEVEFKDNFRIPLAITKPYKGTRKADKPLHFYNITHYILGAYDCVVTNGIEADDALGAYQCSNEDTIICSRDKDLRMIPGWHYGWECGKQPSFGPTKTDSLGWISGTSRGVKGMGLLFFFAQMLMGDSVDNIPGLKGCGPVRTLSLLEGCTNEFDASSIVKGAYEDKYGDDSQRMLNEQSGLLWIARELDERGEVVPYVLNKGV